MGRILSAALACLAHDDDLRNSAAHHAFEQVIAQSVKGAVVSVGGGPTRVHARLINLNILVEQGVDIAGDAFALPLRTGALAGIHCEAVLEHLEYPDSAAREIYRVLRPEGLLFAATPFLQPYHAYPDHYQNYTLRGHARLFERAGFSIVDSGACVGPAFAVVDLIGNCCRELLPGRFLPRAAGRIVRSLGRVVRLADLAATGASASHVSSSTFVLARKPADDRARSAVGCGDDR